MNSACLGTRAWIEYDVLVCSLGRLSDSSMSELWPFLEILLPTLLKELWVMITADRKVGSGECQTRNKTNSGGWEGTALCALQSEWFSYRWVNGSLTVGWGILSFSCWVPGRPTPWTLSYHEYTLQTLHRRGGGGGGGGGVEEEKKQEGTVRRKERRKREEKQKSRKGKRRKEGREGGKGRHGYRSNAIIS